MRPAWRGRGQQKQKQRSPARVHGRGNAVILALVLLDRG